MKKRLGFRGVFVGGLACLGLALGCGGRTEGDGGGTGGGGTGGGGGGSGDTGHPCDDYFQAAFAGPCSEAAAVAPASELARVQARFDTVCAQALALPGVGLTGAGLEACVSAVQSTGCFVLNQPNGPCDFAGSLAAEAPCVLDVQCQSGSCSAGSETQDGTTLACGACEPAIGLGQSCGIGESCGQEAICYGAASGDTCMAVEVVGEGGSCETAQQVCSPGLYCVAAVCKAPAGSGSSCEEDEECAPPFICPAAAVPSACALPSGEGGPCNGASDCVAGLECDPTSRQCATVTWADAGQPCGGSTLCLVGLCNTIGAAVAGTCPSVIADGQPCSDVTDSATTCDTLASCVGGTCVLGYAACP